MCTRFVDRAQQSAGARFDQAELTAAGTADIGQVGRRLVFCPEPSGRPCPQHLPFHEIVDDFGRIVREVHEVGRLQRHLGGGRTQVTGEHVRIARMDDAGVDGESKMTSG